MKRIFATTAMALALAMALMLPAWASGDPRDWGLYVILPGQPIALLQTWHGDRPGGYPAGFAQALCLTEAEKLSAQLADLGYLGRYECHQRSGQR